MHMETGPERVRSLLRVTQQGEQVCGTQLWTGTPARAWQGQTQFAICLMRSWKEVGEELLACSPPEGSWGAWVGSAVHRGPAQSWYREDCSGLSLGLSFPVCTVRAAGLRQGGTQ